MVRRLAVLLVLWLSPFVLLGGTIFTGLSREDFNLIKAAPNPSDVLNDVSLTAALGIVGSSPAAILLRTGTWTIANNLTVPAHVTLQLAAGAILSVNSGRTLTILGTLNAPRDQIFAGAGTIRLGSKTSVAHVEWFGAKCDGATADHVAIQKAIDSLPFDAGTTVPVGIVQLPAGTCTISAGLIGRGNTIFQGVSKSRTTIQYSGVSPIALLTYSSTADFTIRDVSFKTDKENSASVHIHILNSSYFDIENVFSWIPLTPSVPANNQVVGILVEGNTSGLVPSPGFGTIRNYVYTCETGCAGAGSRGIELRGVPAQDVRFMTIDGYYNLEGAGHGILFTYASLSTVAGAGLLQGNQTGITFNIGANHNTVINTRFQESSNHINIVSGAVGNTIVKPTFAVPATFGVDNGSDTIRIFADAENESRLRHMKFQDSSAATGVGRGIVEIEKLFDKDTNALLLSGDVVPTGNRAWIKLERGSDSSRDLVDIDVNGAAAFRISPTGCLHLGGGTQVCGYSRSGTVLDFGILAAGATVEAGIPVAQSAAGDMALCSPDAGGVEGALIWSCFAGAGQVIVRLHNTSVASVDPIPAAWSGAVLKNVPVTP